MNARLIETEDGGQIVILPPGFEFAAAKVELTKDGNRVIISPVPIDQDAES